MYIHHIFDDDYNEICAVSAYLHRSPHNHAIHRIFFPTQTDYKTQIKYTLAVRLWFFLRSIEWAWTSHRTMRLHPLSNPIPFFFPSVVFSLVCCWINIFLISSTERERIVEWEKKKNKREKWEKL